MFTTRLFVLYLSITLFAAPIKSATTLVHTPQKSPKKYSEIERERLFQPFKDNQFLLDYAIYTYCVRMQKQHRADQNQKPFDNTKLKKNAELIKIAVLENAKHKDFVKLPQSYQDLFKETVPFIPTQMQLILCSVYHINILPYLTKEKLVPVYAKNAHYLTERFKQNIERAYGSSLI